VRWPLAVATGCCTGVPVMRTLEDFHEAGVTAIELGTPPQHFDPCNHHQVAEVGHRLRTLRMQVASIHAPFGGHLDLSEPSAHHRHAAIGATLAAAVALREVGGARVIVHPTDTPRDGRNLDERLARCLDGLQMLARACRHLGVQLVLETPLPHLIGGHPDEFAWLARGLDRSVGICFDTGHLFLGGQWDRFAGLVGDRLVHVHANDNRGQFDDHLPPGEGAIDWLHVRDTLDQVAFDGWIVLELACPSDPFVESIRAAVARTCAALNLLTS